MKEIFNRGKELLQDHQHRLEPALVFTGKCINEIAAVGQLEKNNIINYINLGFKFKTHFKETFKEEANSSFLNKNWKRFLVAELQTTAVQIVLKHFKDQLKVTNVANSNNNNCVAVLEPGVKIGWVGSNNYIDCLYVSAGQDLRAKRILAQKIWEDVNNQCISLDTVTEGWRTYFIISPETTHNQYAESPQTSCYQQHLLKYKEKNLGRAILFYGPPGTGKSNLIKAVANSLQLKTIRLQKLDTMRSAAIAEVIDLFDPDLIVMEDIDHLYSYGIGPLLERIENFNCRGRYLLATANEIGKIHSALLRPGRFDELIEITSSDQEFIKKLVKDDPEIFELVKNYPVAFINEVVKRVETIGKEETLKNINDIKRRVEKFHLNVEYKL